MTKFSKVYMDAQGLFQKISMQTQILYIFKIIYCGSFQKYHVKKLK